MSHARRQVLARFTLNYEDVKQTGPWRARKWPVHRWMDRGDRLWHWAAPRVIDRVRKLITRGNMEKEQPRSRFDDLTAEMLYRLSIDGWANETSGSTDSPTGWFARISINAQELPELSDAFEEVFQGAEFREPTSLLGHFLLKDLAGIVEVTEFDSEAEVTTDYRQLASEYAAWLAEGGRS